LPDGSDVELGPPPSAGCPVGAPSPCDVPRNDEIGTNQSASPGNYSLDERGGNTEWRVCDDLERAAREAEIRRVGGNDNDVLTAELSTKDCRPRRVEFHSDDAGAARYQSLRDGTLARADVEDEVARCDLGCRDEAAGPAPIELVPSPPRPRFPGHGRPWP